MTKKPDMVLILVCVFVGIPVFSCAGCMGLGVLSNLMMSDEARAAMEAEQAAAEAEAKQRIAEAKEAEALAARRYAAEQARQNQQLAALSEKRRKMYVDRLQAAGIEYVSGLDIDGDTLTVQVANTWLYEPHGIRLQAAQNLYSYWRLVVGFDDPAPGFSVVDVNGNELGGFSAWNGLWVQD